MVNTMSSGNMDPRERKLLQMLQQQSAMLAPQGLINNNQKNMSGIRFRVGDRVALMKFGNDTGDEDNPVWGWEKNYIAGTVEWFDESDGEVRIKWDNGNRNDYDSWDSDQVIDTLDNANKKIKKGVWGGEKVALKTAELDALVLDTDTKTEIFAVLKQHQNAKKIFEEWGLAEVIEYGRGMTMMFHGAPGTGKTWGANCIAKALGKELLTIDAANIQTSEPGGANRNIQQAFATAASSGQVLLLDECDSLITQRGEVGMILASEINTLLTEIEKFEGVCILATNRIGSLDPALERRISLIAEFPEPDFKAREAIWTKMLPPKMPIGRGVNAKKLAEEMLTGGQIKNAVLSAARAAVADDCDQVDKKHFDKAIERIHKSKSLMGKDRGHVRATGQSKRKVSSDVTKG